MFDLKGFSDISNFLEIWLKNNLLPEKEQETFNNYYKSYKKHFGSYIKKNYTKQTKEIMKIIENNKGLKILEIGCGCGTESLWFSMKGADVTAIDIDQKLLSVANYRKKIIEKDQNTRINCNFINKSILDLKDIEKFNIVYMEQTFHHLEPRKKIIDKVAKITKLNGYIIISETNGWNILNQLILFKLRGFKTIIRHLDCEWGNERITVPLLMNKYFRKKGVRKVSLHYFRVLPNIKIADKLTKIDNIIPKFLPIFFTHYNYVGKKIQLL